MTLLGQLGTTALAGLRDLLPIIIILLAFQVLFLRRLPADWKRMGLGIVYVFVGLTLFTVGLEEALFPLGELMARQLTAPDFIAPDALAGSTPGWGAYAWVYVFAASIGFATTIAEPALIAVAIKANQVSGGSVSVWGLRIAVAVGVAIGVALGAVRIVTGTPLYLYIVAGYMIVILQTLRAPRSIIALAYDSGGVTTSTVTVPLLTALGLGLASNVPGRSPLLDGFGLIAFASLFPIVCVLGYAQLSAARQRHTHSDTGEEEQP